MARIARVAVPGFPHHVVQRGNRRQRVFFYDKDYTEYLNLLALHCREFEVKVAAYCLMPNHVHLIVTPKTKEGFIKAIGETHRKYTRMINFREDWKGYLWQGRFSSYILDEPHLLMAAKYILFNPVKARLADNPVKYKWSSIKHHLGTEKISFLQDEILQSYVQDWHHFLNQDVCDKDANLIARHQRTGRPLGSELFVSRLEEMLGIKLKKQKPGPKKKETGA